MGEIAIKEDNTVVTMVEPQDAFMPLLARALDDPKFDLDRVEKIIDMRNAELLRLAEIEYNTSLAAAQAEMEPIAKNAENKHTKSSYASIDAIAEKITPIIAKHGFGTAFNVGKQRISDHMFMTLTITHRGGFSKTFEDDVPMTGTGLKGNTSMTATHSHGATQTYARRYMKVMGFDVAVKALDLDGNAPKTGPITPEQAGNLRKLLDGGEVDIAGFCEMYGIEKYSALPADKWDAALFAIGRATENKRAAAK